ncbi:MAG: heme lyase CcmF/NrfE family subunit [Pseudomonadota bacterium]|nr:heme lyase CcmF/NrfE family subunit [Pseudomonadota bacterium]
MYPELGQLALILALLLAVLLSVVPLLGSIAGRDNLQAFARPLASGLFVFVALAFALLTQAFLTDDFSVAYVANNSNSMLPWYYKFSAVWGGHEGSLLLWILMLAGWTLAVAIFSRRLPAVMISQVLSVLGMVTVGFLLFIIITSNPFDRLLPNVPADGADLNPLLQDFGLIVHPPMLYMGYVGFSVAFAFAIAALMNGRLDAAWARWSRPWTTVAWAFLSLGIALGSWWAYYELGWGGWWFWDPVENASLMPWLVATALLHSLAVTEKRGLFKSWTVLLAIFAFSLSLLGTFLVRSGVLTSVHAFASDPERGVFVLALLGLVVGGSLLIYALKAPTVASVGRYEWLSRESFLLMNNLLLLVAAFAILLGTLYPLAIDFLGMGKISVGASWFNLMFVPISVVLTLIIGVGAMSRWKQDKANRLTRETWWAAVAALLLGIAAPLVASGELNWSVVMGIGISVWLVAVSLADVWKKCRGQLSRIPSLSLSFNGMILAHIGVAVTVVGVTMVANYSIEESVRMAPGDSYVVDGYRFEFERAGHIEGPNYVSDAAQFVVYDGDDEIAVLRPEKRRYLARNTIMTEAAIDVNLLRDVYVSMGEPLDDGAWGMRIQVKPFMRWVWLGAIFMAVGGVLAMFDKRYRQRKQTADAQEALA